jgi:DNA helicase-2/ATP-dependent DNA helicase PcrA
MTTTDLESLRDRVAGDEPILLIEAPAGHGKTEEGVVAAQRAAQCLPHGREILFLTHTNSARETFNRRLGRSAAVMKTIHSLAAEIVELYATPLGLPRPLQPYHAEPTFDDMMRHATDLLKRRPEVARGLAVRHPLILVDEYQDCTEDQHALVQLVAAAGPARLRLFGDHLQGIFDFTGAQVNWEKLSAAHPTMSLTTPWRWKDNPGMASFLVEARAALLAGEAIDLRSPPSCVTVHRWDGPVPGPKQEGHAPACLEILKSCCDDGTVVITHHNTHALGLRRKLPGRGSYHEGSDHEPARTILEEVVAAQGNAPALAALLIQAMHEWGTGMTKPYREQVTEICQPDGVVTGTKQKILGLARLCERLYENPTTSEWLSCLRKVLDGEHGVDSWRVLRSDPIYLLTRLYPGTQDDPVALLHGEARARDAARKAPKNGFMTIHKAKGLEFDTVAIPYCAGTLFEDDLPSRCRMYVAISRAQSHLHLLVPNGDPTPLLLI